MKTIYKWTISHGYVNIPEGMTLLYDMIWPGFLVVFSLKKWQCPSNLPGSPNAASSLEKSHGHFAARVVFLRVVLWVKYPYPHSCLRIIPLSIALCDSPNLRTPAFALLALGDVWSDHDDDDLGRFPMAPKLLPGIGASISNTTIGLSFNNHENSSDQVEITETYCRDVTLSFATLSNSSLLTQAHSN